MSELKILIDLAEHEENSNVVKLLGAVTKNFSEGKKSLKSCLYIFWN